MNTSELIKLLQESDPEGNTEVCIDNIPVYYVDRLPAYYDGDMLRYIPELPLKGFHDTPDKMELVSDGHKVNIVYYDWDTAMWDSDGKIELINSDRNNSHFVKKVEEERQRVLDHMAEYDPPYKMLDK